MTKDEYLENVLTYIDDKYAKLEVKNELEAHLDDRIAFYTGAGYDYDYALEKAIERMGDSQTVGLQMNALHNNKKFNTFTWIFAILFCVVGIGFRNYVYFDLFDDTMSNLLAIASIIFHTGVLLFTIAFILASKRKNYKALMLISIVSLLTFGRIVSYFYMGEAKWYLSPLYAPSVLFTHTSDSISTVLEYVFSAFGIYDTCYMFFAGVFGILFSTQIKLHLNGKAKTNILKRYQALNTLTFIALSTEILSLIIFFVSFVFLMRS